MSHRLRCCTSAGLTFSPGTGARTPDPCSVPCRRTTCPRVGSLRCHVWVLACAARDPRPPVLGQLATRQHPAHCRAHPLERGLFQPVPLPPSPPPSCPALSGLTSALRVAPAMLHREKPRRGSRGDSHRAANLKLRLSLPEKQARSCRGAPSLRGARRWLPSRATLPPEGHEHARTPDTHRSAACSLSERAGLLATPGRW